MKKFRDVMSRWELGELSMMEAGELLGTSEWQLRRYRGRYEGTGGGAGRATARQAVAKAGPGGGCAADAGSVWGVYPGLEREAFPQAPGARSWLSADRMLHPRRIIALRSGFMLSPKA